MMMGQLGWEKINLIRVLKHLAAMLLRKVCCKWSTHIRQRMTKELLCKLEYPILIRVLAGGQIAKLSIGTINGRDFLNRQF